MSCSKQKQKNQEDQNLSESKIKPWLKTGTTKKHVSLFSELLLTDKFSFIFEWMLHHTIDHILIFIHWLLLTFYITCTYNYTVYIDYFDASTYTIFAIHWSTRFSVLLFKKSSILRNSNNRIDDAEVASFEQFNWNLM